MKNNFVDKIIFTTIDDKGNKIQLKKKMNLKEIAELSNTKDNTIKIHFNFLVWFLIFYFLNKKWQMKNDNKEYIKIINKF